MDTFTTNYHFSHHYSYPHHEIRSPLQHQHRLQSSEEPPRSSLSCATLGRNDTILNPYIYPFAYAKCVDKEDNTSYTYHMIGYESGGFTDVNCKNANGSWEHISCRDAEDFYQNNTETSDFEMLASWWSQNCCFTTEEIRQSYWDWPAQQNIREESKNSILIRGVMGMISTIASSIFIWMLRRSHDGFSTTQNRILLGLCLSDILFSLQFLFFGMMVPKEYYSSWNARGNMVTCSISGILFFAGAIIGPFYNAALCVLYLAIVKYEKSNEYIRTKLEPFFHTIPVVGGCGYCIFRLVEGSINPNQFGGCYDRGYHPGHCVGQKDGFVIEGIFLDIPCAGDVPHLIEYILTLIPPISMITCLAMVYRKVLQTEYTMSKYGSRSILIKKTTDSTCTNEESITAFRILDKLKDRFVACSSSKREMPATTSKVKLKKRKKRAHSRLVMYKGLAYSCSWLITWGFFMPSVFFTPGSFWIYFTSVCLPLQGLFNLAIFMHPAILSAKNSTKENLTWWQAFLKAFWSKGLDKKKRGGRRALKISGAGQNGSERKTKKSKDRNIMKADNDISWANRSQPLRTKSTLPQSEKTEPRDVTYLSFRRCTDASKTYHFRTDPFPPRPLHTGMVDMLIDDGTSSNTLIASIEKNSGLAEENNRDIEAASTLSAKIEKVSNHTALFTEEDSSLSVSSIPCISNGGEKAGNKVNFIVEDNIHISHECSSKDGSAEEKALDCI